MTNPYSLEFKVYIIEEYRMKHGLTAPETLELFDRYGVLGFLENTALLGQSLTNTVLDVEEFIDVRMGKEVPRRYRCNSTHTIK